jgi:hypothetical protein
MSTPQDRLARIEHAWSMFAESDGPPVSDVRWLIAEVKRLRTQEQLLRSGLEQIAEAGDPLIAQQVLELEGVDHHDPDDIQPQRSSQQAEGM